ncbi:MAG: hypothetical protein NT154_20905 [Verrucomicrobia bacterium]|nr:hypothetical protein [Verrucomicrobiota bacterium]
MSIFHKVLGAEVAREPWEWEVEVVSEAPAAPACLALADLAVRALQKCAAWVFRVAREDPPCAVKVDGAVKVRRKCAALVGQVAQANKACAAQVDQAVSATQECAALVAGVRRANLARAAAVALAVLAAPPKYLPATTRNRLHSIRRVSKTPTRTRA